MSDPAAIARSLNAAQKGFVARGSARTAQQVRDLNAKGLCGGWAQYHPSGPYYFELNQTGLAVQSILKTRTDSPESTA